MKSLDIILPIYNPKGQWIDDIIEHYNALADVVNPDFNCNLILVNDGSNADLEEGFRQIKSAIPCSRSINYHPNKGKGYALRKGVSLSHADCVLYTDYDFPYTTESMREALLLVNEGHNVVVGHRNEDYYKDHPWIRIKISHYLKTINRLLLGLNLDDTQCGLKAFNADIRPVFMNTHTNRFLIDVEFIKRLTKNKIDITVIDVHIRPDVKLSKVKIRTLMTEVVSYLRILLFT